NTSLVVLGPSGLLDQEQSLTPALSLSKRAREEKAAALAVVAAVQPCNHATMQPCNHAPAVRQSDPPALPPDILPVAMIVVFRQHPRSV
ncbi:MAG: hypothetical protein ACK4UN_15155, partial [Limisphaerales bacterium]